MLLTTYAAGLRLNEVLHLRVARHRLGAHDDSRRAGQGRQGPLHGALGAPARRRCARTGSVARPRAVAVSVGSDARSRWIRPRLQRAYQHGEAARGHHQARAAFTGCATPLRRTCSKPASTSTRFNGCSATATSARRRATCSLTRHTRDRRQARRSICSSGSPRRRRAEPCAPCPRGTAGSRARPRLELADIVRAHGDAYRRTHRLAARPAPGAPRDRDLPHRRPRRASGDV